MSTAIELCERRLAREISTRMQAEALLEQKSLQLYQEAQERELAVLALRKSESQFRLMFERTADALLLLDSTAGRFINYNQAAVDMLRYPDKQAMLSLRPDELSPAHQPDGRPSKEKADEMIATAMRNGSHRFELIHCSPHRTDFPVEVLLTTIQMDEHQFMIATLRDITERKVAESELIKRYDKVQELNSKLQETQNQLLQSEKMASIGQLAAGVAHEINNPIGYVYSNLGTLEKYVQDVFSMIDDYERAEGAIADSEVRTRLQVAREKLDIVFLKDDLRVLMDESKEGITRVKNIVQNLKDFSHVDASDEWHFTNLHKGLDSTLNIVNNEIKYKAEVVKEYGDIPEVECLSSQLNQVFMNLLVNAAHAIEERGTITIRTGSEAEEVWVEIADTGTGIEPEHIQKIFDPFFTTKPIGKGTGLGLSLSYGIVQKHHGRIEVQSELGKGTAFRMWLPVSHA